MGILGDSLLWVMQDVYNQPHDKKDSTLNPKTLNPKPSAEGFFGPMPSSPTRAIGASIDACAFIPGVAPRLPPRVFMFMFRIL